MGELSHGQCSAAIPSSLCRRRDICGAKIISSLLAFNLCFFQPAASSPDMSDSPASRRRSQSYAVFSLCLTLLLGACGDAGVIINESGSSSPGSSDDSAGGNDGTGGNPVVDNGSSTDGELSEPDGDGPTGTPAPTTSVSNLDPADVSASRFLAQTTFGPTPTSIRALREAGSPGAWIDAQMSLPVSRISAYTRANSNGSNTAARHEAWWNNALSQPDQLRQRVAFALSQIFVVSDIDYALANAQYGMADYYDMLSENAFGNYRDLLEQVALHPVMGVYLSMVRNEQANPAENVRPDENFAREVLQLFSIGLYELNLRGEALPANDPVPAYTQQTVEEFARVFTGWNYADVSWTTNNLGFEPYTQTMVPDETYHDTGAKTLLRNSVSPAGLNTRQDLQAALDNIFQHPNVAPFIGKQLIQRLVTSNPSPDYVQRVASAFNDNGAGTRGDLAAVVRAILLDEEALSGHLSNPDFGKLREPVVRFAHFWRALDGTPGPEANGIHSAADFRLSRLDEMSGQAILRSRSVFNFYLPDNPIVPGGNTLAPEMQIMTEANLAATHNNYHHQVYRFNNRSDLTDDNPRVTVIDLAPLTAIAGNRNTLLDWYNLVFFAGNMSDPMRQLLFNYMGTLNDDEAGRFARAQDTLFMVLVAPEFHVQR